MIIDRLECIFYEKSLELIHDNKTSLFLINKNDI